ncbi:MAG: FAD-dependent oxidoreductase [Candidatus Limivivens sp.]|nr:FAD-dependent oxidoreductase [Candidatus Limivivens sp.]
MRFDILGCPGIDPLLHILGRKRKSFGKRIVYLSGGVLVGEQAIPFKYAMYDLAKTYERLCIRAGVEIRRRTKVTPDYVKKEQPDELVLALGAEPWIPPIPGIQRKQVIHVTEYYRHTDEIKQEIAVLGGGLAGCEIALHLGQTGHLVHLIEMKEELCTDANAKFRPVLLEYMDGCVQVHTGCRVIRILEDCVLCEDQKGEKVVVPAKSVICALGQKPRRRECEELRRIAPCIRIIGDAERVSSIMHAMYQGYHAGLDL